MVISMDTNLLGTECNFIVNLSLSEGKQWGDLRAIYPSHLGWRVLVLCGDISQVRNCNNICKQVVLVAQPLLGIRFRV